MKGGNYLCLLLIGFFVCSLNSFSQKKASGASRMSEDLKQCVTQAINGRETGQCSGENRESDDCVGLRLSIQNSLKTTECKQYSYPICHRYGYKQNHQSKWIAVSSGHLSLFANCVRDAYPLNDRNDLSAALEDDSLVKFLQSIDDGASSYGLAQGAILLNLLKGIRLSDSLKESAVGKKMEPQLLQEIIESAETPTPIEIAGNNKSINDLSTEQIVFPLASEEKKRVYERTIATFSPGSSLEELSPSARKSEEKKIGKNSSELNVYKRVIKNNIYSLGLDRSLFERISAAYMRRLSELQPMGEYLKMTPKGPPKDVKELIQRGRPVNL